MRYVELVSWSSSNFFGNFSLPTHLLIHMIDVHGLAIPPLARVTKTQRKK